MILWIYYTTEKERLSDKSYHSRFDAEEQLFGLVFLEIGVTFIYIFKRVAVLSLSIYAISGRKRVCE